MIFSRKTDILRNMKQYIQQTIFDAIQGLGWDISSEDILVEYPPEEAMGDYTTNVAFLLSKKLHKAPIEIAREIASVLRGEQIDHVEAVMPGYVNIYSTATSLQNIISQVLQEQEQFGGSQVGKGQKVLLEYISSNPTGPIHLGNARGGPIGSVLAEVLKKAGYKVWSEFYVNDFGNQVKILGHSILGDEEKQYSGAYIDELAKQRPAEPTDTREVGFWAAEKILKEDIQPTCERLGISFDRFFSEKSLHTDGKVEAVLSFLKGKGLVYEKEGAQWYRSTEFGDDKDRVLVKTDGRYTYRLADFAYHKDKFDRGFDRLITVLGADHHSEAKEMKVFVEKILEKQEGSYKTILTQFVRVMRDGKEVKMSKRKGTYFALDDLIEEVGRDAVRFGFISYSATSHINFDIDLALERSEKNPVYYVQYAHARMASIMRKAKEKGLRMEEKDFSTLVHPKEKALLRKLRAFPDLIEVVADTYETHRIPQYGRELADLFHSFYAECHITGEKDLRIASARLALVVAVKTALAETLDLCGVSVPEKM